MVLGLVEDERVFSALGFLKSKLRKKLDKNLESCLRVYTSRYDVNTFPYKKEMEIWKKRCKRRGLGNTINQSGKSSNGSQRSDGQSEEDTNINGENNEGTRIPQLDDDDIDNIEINWKI